MCIYIYTYIYIHIIIFICYSRRGLRSALLHLRREWVSSVARPGEHLISIIIIITITISSSGSSSSRWIFWTSSGPPKGYR